MSTAGRVVIATDTTVRGGVDRYVLDLARAGTAAGADVHVLLEQDADPDLGDRLGRDGVPVRRVRLHHRSHEPGVIEQDCRDALAALVPGLLHVVCGVPHSCLALREAATGAAIDTVITEQYVPDDLTMPEVTRRRVAASYAAALCVVFVSAGNRSAMARQLPIDSAEAHVIPNAVPAPTIARLTPIPDVRRRRAIDRRAAAELRVMTAARLAPQKGIDVLIDALALLGPTPGLTLNVFGTGPEQNVLLARSRAREVDGVLRFRGWSTDVARELAEHDLFVLPSRHEGMPYAVLEAMAAGVPVIATDVPGTAEALGDGRYGVVVPRSDATALAGALTGWRNDLDGAHDRAELAFTRVVEAHDLSGCMARTVALWRLPVGTTALR